MTETMPPAAPAGPAPAADAMDPATEALLAEIRRWVEIETPTGHVPGLDAMMDLASAAYEAIGGNVTRIPGTLGQGDHLSIALPWTGSGHGDNRPGILVLSHLDTVHPVGTLAEALPFRVEGARAYGPGIADMKGGAVIALAALRAIHEAGGRTPLPVRVLLTSDEEIGSPTSRAPIEAEAARAAYVLVTEPARNGGKVVTARKGVSRYGLETRGRAAHSGNNHAEGRSAILELARQIVTIEGRNGEMEGTTLNVGRITGGTTDNTVPEFAMARIDVRTPTAAAAEEIDAWLRTLRAVDPDVTLTLTGGPNRPPMERNAGVAALFDHASALAAEIGFELEETYSGGGSDGSFTAATVPTLDGLGVDGAKVHTHDEHLMVPSILPRMRLMRRLFETLA